MVPTTASAASPQATPWFSGGLGGAFRRLPARGRASLIHLSCSITIVVLLMAIVFFVWYPAPYAAASGVVPVFALLCGVDVTLGPFLTLIVFNPKKKSLRFDLTVIVVVQLCALAYGMYSVFKERPAFVVYNVDRFDIVSANDIGPKHLALARNPEYAHLPVTGPHTVGASLPTEREERNNLLFATTKGGADIPQLPQYYRPINEVTADIQSHLKPLSALRAQNANADSRALKRLAVYEEPGANAGYVPMRGRVKDYSVIMNRATTEVLAILPLDPW
jgi:hypothetical protein